MEWANQTKSLLQNSLRFQERPFIIGSVISAVGEETSVLQY